jgi:hypothetical protein
MQYLQYRGESWQSLSGLRHWTRDDEISYHSEREVMTYPCFEFSRNGTPRVEEVRILHARVGQTIRCRLLSAQGYAEKGHGQADDSQQIGRFHSLHSPLPLVAHESQCR